MTANTLQAELIRRFAARHHTTPEAAARTWIARHARQFRAWWERHNRRIQ